MFKAEKTKLLVTDKDALIGKLKIQLAYDNLTQSAFFKLIIDSYLNRDERVISLLEEANPVKYNKAKRKKDRLETKKTITDFALEENDLEDIFDIIAKENPDL
jgi:hypothetical protein